MVAAIALMAFLVPIKGWGQTRTDFEFNLNALYQNGSLVTEKTVISTSGGTLTFTDKNEDFTILMTRNSGNQPGFYTSSGYIRFYNNDTFKLSAADGITMTKIVITSNGSSFSLSSMTGLNTSTKTWEGSASEVTFTGSGTNKWDKLTITYTSGGSTTTPTTVTIDATGITNNDIFVSTAAGSLTATVTENVNNTVISGATVTWSSSNTNVATVDGGVVTLVAAGTTSITASYAGDATTYSSSSATYNLEVVDNTPSTDQWVLTELADLTSTDVFVIVGNNGLNFAMSNDKGTGAAPAAVSVTVAGGKITGTVAANIQWNISGNATDGYTFYPNGSTTTWLYCTNTNNGVRVGTNSDKTFKLDQTGYLKHDGSSRFVGVYNSQDWRCYTSAGGNIANQTFAFYKKVTGGVVVPSISANNVGIGYDVTSSSIAYTINNEPDPVGTLTASTTETWLTLGTPANSAVPFTCSVNDAAAARTATVTLTYTYDSNETVTKDVTVTQAAAPVIYTTIPQIFEAATSTETDVNVTFNDWIVSGVSTNGKNVYVTDNDGNGFIIFDNNGGLDQTYSAGNVLTGTSVSCKLVLYKGAAELKDVTATDLTITDGGNVTEATIAMANLSGVNTGALVHYENLTCSVNNNKYYLSDGTTTIQLYNALYAFENPDTDKTYNITGVYVQYDNTKEIMPRSADDIEEVVVIEPTVTLENSSIEAPAEGLEGNLEVTYTNFTDDVVAEVLFFEVDGETSATYDWLEADIDDKDVTNLYFIIDANDGVARTAYFKVYATDGENEAYSGLITVSQAAYVVPTYAELPFEFDGGRADIEGTDGLSQENLGTDYNASPKLKFEKGNKDNDGLYSTLILQFTERPGTLTFDIKGNSFSDGTFTVQTSENGVTYTDLETYNELGAVQHESFDNLGEDVRYIRWIYTEKVNGNVALGNIALSAYEAPVAAITVDPNLVEATADLTEGYLAIALENITISQVEDHFDVYFCDSEGTIFGPNDEKPNWLMGEVQQEGNVFSLYYLIDENTEPEPRTAYMKVYGLGDDGSTEAYSNIVTVTQDAYVAPVASITVAPDIMDLDAKIHYIATDSAFTITYQNIEVTNYQSFAIHYYNAEGEEIQLGDDPWHILGVGGTNEEGYQVVGVVLANDGDARTAYFKVSDVNNTVYSNLVTVTQAAYVAPPTPGNNYVKVTSTADLTDGQYLIVYEEGDLAFDGSLTTLDAVSNTIPVTISNNEIAVTSETAASEFTIASISEGYSIQSASGYYIGQTSDANGLASSDEIVYTNAISFDEGNANIVSSGAYLRYNSASNQARFRYYKSSSYTGQKAIQLYKKVEATETYTLDITGYGTSAGGYRLIASPVTVDPLTTGMITDPADDYDLFYFNQNEDQEWRNWKSNEEDGHFDLVPGKGYLYANRNDVTITLTGAPYTGNGVITLDKTEGAQFSGLNLVGNPFGTAATINSEKSCYILNEAGTEFIAGPDTIAAMQGIIVYASVDEEELTFTPVNQGQGGNGKSSLNINLMQTIERSNSLVDRAIVRFDNGDNMPKIQFNPNHTKVYIPQDGTNYAVVNAEIGNIIPVNFKAAENGIYTLNFTTENLDLDYLHLIDFATSNDVDLLTVQNYSFEATTTDHVDRFRLVFSATGIDENANENGFAFVSNGNIIVTGEGTLRIVDIMGRVIGSYNTNERISTEGMTSGIYVLQLINGEKTMTQKIVVR